MGYFGANFFGGGGTAVPSGTPVADGGVIETSLAKDFSQTLTASSDSGARIIASFRRKLNQAAPDLQLDTTTGLLVVSGVDSPTAGDGSVTRDSSSQVTVYIKADAFDHLDPGVYHFDLTQILSGVTLKIHCAKVAFSRSAGRVMAS